MKPHTFLTKQYWSAIGKFHHDADYKEKRRKQHNAKQSRNKVEATFHNCIIIVIYRNLFRQHKKILHLRYKNRLSWFFI